MSPLKITNLASTALLCLMTAGGAIMYFVKYNDVAVNLSKLDFPLFLIYPLAISKLLAVAVILSKKWDWAVEWAYAGLTFVFCLAISAHLNAGDGEQTGAIVALIMAMVSYSTYKYLLVKE
jgi:hypothetical protein